MPYRDGHSCLNISGACGELREVRNERDEERAALRMMLHAFESDNRPNLDIVRRALGEPERSMRMRAEGERGVEPCLVLNPGAIGNPDETPIVQLSPEMVALLVPCDGAAPSRGGRCGGVNGFHADDCPERLAGGGA